MLSDSESPNPSWIRSLTFSKLELLNKTDILGTHTCQQLQEPNSQRETFTCSSYRYNLVLVYSLLFLSHSVERLTKYAYSHCLDDAGIFSYLAGSGVSRHVNFRLFIFDKHHRQLLHGICEWKESSIRCLE